MLVTRVEVFAQTTSFRLPYFLVGRQPSYEMPPLSTVYGHLCSAVGEWVDPNSLVLGYRFTYRARVDDLEHQTMIVRASGRLPGSNAPKVTGGSVVPTRREFLFDAHMTLYVGGDWTAAFKAPRYAAVLGRSQDLASYSRVDLMDLERTEAVCYEWTLLPWRLRPRVLRARAETMPRWIDYENGRQSYFDRFLVVTDSIFTDRPDHFVRSAGDPDFHWSDPQASTIAGRPRGVWMHPLTKGED